MDNRKINPLMVELYIGNGFNGSALQSCFSIIASLANDQYSIDQLKQDIKGKFTRLESNKTK
jgi:hypothetical protein